MWLQLAKEKLVPLQAGAWDSLIRAAFDLLRATEHDEDPWLFHGCTATKAGWTLRQGFTPGYLVGSPGRGLLFGQGIYWGHPAVAAAFAERFADETNPPVIFAARSSDVARSTPDGLLRPDYFACEESACPRSCPDGMDEYGPEMPVYRLGGAADLDGLEASDDDGLCTRTWQQSLAYSGAVTAPSGRHVPNLVLFAMTGALGPAPEGEMRQAFANRRRVPPGMEESIDPRDTIGAARILSPEDVMPGLEMSFGR